MTTAELKLDATAMKPSKLIKHLEKLVPAHENTLILGSPGIGKTDLIKHLVLNILKWRLLIAHPVIEEPTDWKGFPWVVQNGGEPRAEFVPFGNMREMLYSKDPLVVFFDDVGQALQATQAAIMQPIWGGTINGVKIPDTVYWIAASNRRGDKAGVQGMITPLLDRFNPVVTQVFDLDDWVAWGLENKMPPVLLAFTRFKPDLVKFEANRDMRKSCTPRSLAALGRHLNLGITDVGVWAGDTGEGHATEFKAFYQVWTELPDRNEIYMNPTKVPVPQKLDVLYALMGSLAHGARKDNFSATMTYVERCPQNFQVVFMRDACRREPKLTKTAPYIKWVTTHQNVFGYDED